MADSSNSLHQPRLSVAALGVLAGIGALWVYAAMRRHASERGSGRRGERRDPLRRTRTIRRERRQAVPTVAATIRDESSGSSTGGGSSSSGEEEEEEEGGSGVGSSADMRMLHVLCTVAEDQARRSAVVHRGTVCSSCQDSPIRGVRFRCAQCADYDVCERCEAHDAHRHHALLKIAVPLPPLATSRVPLLRTPFAHAAGPSDVPRDAAYRALERLLGRGELASLHASFSAIVGHASSMSRAQFLACLGPYASSLLAARLFAFYDADGDGVLAFDELARAVALCAQSSVAEKAPAVFRAYDVDADGRVSRADMRCVLESCAEVNRELTRAAVRALEDDVVEDPAKLLAGQPVSAAFSAAIPNDHQHYHQVSSSAAAHIKPTRRLSSKEESPPTARLPLTVWHDATEDDSWPAMDALTHDAVRMMLDDIFADATPADPDFLTHDEFLRYLRRNPSLSIYLEVLGPIF
ncbi:hypothetical protein GGI20_005654 [Coemansia sp. BCRC 34301]|nr:hypothetical protein GGI20_005654 [Coemansia sp. BCRC 34301]